MFLIVLMLWNALPQAYRLYHWLVYEWGIDGESGQRVLLTEETRQAILAAGATALPFVAGVLQFLSQRIPLVKKVEVVLLVLSGPIFFLVTFLVLSDYFMVPDVKHGHASHAPEPSVLGLSRQQELWLLFAIVTLYGGVLVNINYTSPHRYYHRQLSRTYLRRSKRDVKNKQYLEETVHEDAQLLSQLTGGDGRGPVKAPYHFINCALNIPDCDDPNLRGRNSDFFVFSKHFSGSPIVGYSRTAEWEAIDGHLDLGTAMSISTAAASPQMGANTNAALSYLLAILNVRLNYWAAPPRKPDAPDKLRGPRWLLRICTPGWLNFFKEMTGLWMNENSNYLNLSDGGHVENLALYEFVEETLQIHHCDRRGGGMP